MELNLLQRLAITARERKEWYRALAKIAEDGLPQFDALERMGKEFTKTKHPMAPLIDVVLLRLRGAGTARLGASRRTLGTELMSLVPDDEAMLIQAGEESGRHSVGLLNAVRLIDAKDQMKSTVFAALLKPVGYILAMVGLLLFFSLKLMPQFEKTRPRAEWPPSAQLLGLVADNVGLISFSVFVFFVLCALLVSQLAPKWTGEARDWADLHLFPFNLIAAINGASFLTSVSGYVSAGTPFGTAIEHIDSTGNPYLQSQCNRVLSMMKRGRRPEESLCDLPIIPMKYHWIINIYAMSDDSAAAYKTISEEMVRSVQGLIEKLFGWVISNVLLVCIGVMLFWIYGSMFEIALSGKTGF